MFRCGICNVVSRNLIEHDKHLEGKRHKRNFSLAAGTAENVSNVPGKRRKKDIAAVEAALERIAAEAAAETEAALETSYCL